MIPRFLLVVALLLATPGVTFAHAIRVFASVTPAGDINGYAYAPGGTRIAGQPVHLEDAEGEKLITTTTGADGTFHFPAPPDHARLVVVELADGHRGQFRLPRPQPDEPLAPPPPGETDALHARIATLERDVRFRDIIGGIGYIVGLFGLLAWWQSRRPVPPRSTAP
jgi:nickel transport protein